MASAGRKPRRWIRAVRPTTVLAGVVLGLVLVMVLTFAGAVGPKPIPGFEPAGRPPAPDGALSASQPGVRGSLLGRGDLPPGYAVGPVADAVRDGMGPAPSTTTAPLLPGASPAPGLLPALGLPDLPLDDPVLGGTPLHPDGGGPADGAAGPQAPGGHVPGGHVPGGQVPGGGILGGGPTDGDGPGRGEHGHSGDRWGAGPADRRTRCRQLLTAPWQLAPSGHRPPAPPQLADHLDRERDVRLRQAIVRFAGADADDAVARMRGTALGCSRFRLQPGAVQGPGAGRRDAHGRVAREPGAARPGAPGPGAGARSEHRRSDHGRDDRTRGPWREDDHTPGGRNNTDGTAGRPDADRADPAGNHEQAETPGHAGSPGHASTTGQAGDPERARTAERAPGDRRHDAQPRGERDTERHRGDRDWRRGARQRQHRGAGATTVTLTPVALGGTPAADGFALQVSIVARNGRAWTGYLTVDRVGSVLSVLWLLGPPGAVTADEVVRTRRTAWAKVHPRAEAGP